MREIWIFGKRSEEINRRTKEREVESRFGRD
jgi:hypothetical protein